jgi:hypothetical protein
MVGVEEATYIPPPFGAELLVNIQSVTVGAMPLNKDNPPPTPPAKAVFPVKVQSVIWAGSRWTPIPPPLVASLSVKEQLLTVRFPGAPSLSWE